MQNDHLTSFLTCLETLKDHAQDLYQDRWRYIWQTQDTTGTIWRITRYRSDESMKSWVELHHSVLDKSIGSWAEIDHGLSMSVMIPTASSWSSLSDHVHGTYNALKAYTTTKAPIHFQAVQVLLEETLMPSLPMLCRLSRSGVCIEKSGLWLESPLHHTVFGRQKASALRALWNDLRVWNSTLGLWDDSITWSLRPLARSRHARLGRYQQALKQCEVFQCPLAGSWEGLKGSFEKRWGST